VTTSYALTYAVAKLRPWPYHLTNVVLHALVSSLLLLCLLRVVEPTLALLTTFLFAIHPIHVEAVANVSNRTELMMSLFGLATLACALHRRERTEARVRNVATLLTIPVLFLLALLSKESALVFLLLVPICCSARSGVRVGVKQSLVPLGCMLGAVAVYLLLRFQVVGGVLAGDYETPVVDNPLVALDGPTRLVNAFALLGRYAALSVFPWELSADYSLARILPIANVASPVVLAELGLVAALAATVLAWRRVASVALWGMWFFASFAVTANLLMPIGTIFSERLAYLPSVGVCGLLAWLLLRIRSERFRAAAIAALALFYVVRTGARNADWADDATLFRREVESGQASARMHNNYGVELSRAGALDAARAQFTRALEIYPAHMHAAYGMAVVAVQEDDLALAKSWLDRALEVDPKHTLSLDLLGKILLAEGRVDDAARLFVRALNADNDDFDAMLGVMVACIRRGNLDQARTIHAQLEQRDRDNPDLIAAGRELGLVASR
jgi:Tfp pilus assembly protein PilF